MREIIATERAIQDGVLIECGVMVNGKKDGDNFIVSIGNKNLYLHKSKCIVLSDFCEGGEKDEILLQKLSRGSRGLC